MALTLVKPKPVAHTEPRKLHCSCGRYLGESTARSGYVVVRCQDCKKWRRLDLGRV